MERLTFEHAEMLKACIRCNDKNCGICTDIDNAIAKLKSYEDAAEQGLLLRLPCKVGDTAYCLSRTYLTNVDKWIHEIVEVEVDSFVLDTKLLANVSIHIRGDRFGKTLTPYKSLFFTKEEAEQALAEMEK